MVPVEDGRPFTAPGAAPRTPAGSLGDGVVWFPVVGAVLFVLAVAILAVVLG